MDQVITTILETDLVICELDPTIPVLKHRWLQKPSSEGFRNQLVELQRAYMKLKGDYPGLKWLADTKLLGELTPDDEKWLEDVWEQLLFVKAGLKAHAVVLSDDIYADYSMEKFKLLADSKFKEVGIKLGVFMNSEDAYEWLKTTD